MKTLFDKTALGNRISSESHQTCLNGRVANEEGEANRTLKNRVWRSTTWMALADEEGRVTEEPIRAYEELAKGGAAVIVTGLTSVVAVDAEIGGGAVAYSTRF